MSYKVDLKTYTPEEVAEIYQVSKANVYKMIQDGRLIAKRINDRQYRIPQSELEWVRHGLDFDLQLLEAKDREILDENTMQLLREIRKGNVED